MVYVATRNKINIYGKNNKTLYRSITEIQKNLQITELKPNFENFVNYIISTYEEENEEITYFVSAIDMNIMNLSLYEAQFLQTFINEKFNKNSFLKMVKNFKQIYSNSLILRKFFNFYFLAAFHNLPNAVFPLYEQYRLEYPNSSE